MSIRSNIGTLITNTSTSTSTSTLSGTFNHTISSYNNSISKSSISKYTVLGTDIELSIDTSTVIIIALINTLGYHFYDNIKDMENNNLPLKLKNLMEEKRISYNRERNIDIVLK